MEDELQALVAEQAALTTLVAGRPDSAWELPSACSGWSVGDVVLHLIQTNELATASAEGRFDELLAGPLYAPDPAATTLDDVVDLAVERGRGLDPAELLARWCTGAAALIDAFAACSSRRVRWVAGELSPRTLVTTRVAETWIHAGDIADGLGVDVAPSPRLELVARLAWRTLPHAFAREGLELTGPVAFELAGIDGRPWRFGVARDAVTVVRGPALDLCWVAARRVEPAATSLEAVGPDAGAVLRLVRTWA